VKFKNLKWSFSHVEFFQNFDKVQVGVNKQIFKQFHELFVQLIFGVVCCFPAEAFSRCFPVFRVHHQVKPREIPPVPQRLRPYHPEYHAFSSDVVADNHSFLLEKIQSGTQRSFINASYANQVFKRTGLPN